MHKRWKKSCLKKGEREEIKKNWIEFEKNVLALVAVVVLEVIIRGSGSLEWLIEYFFFFCIIFWFLEFDIINRALYIKLLIKFIGLFHKSELSDESIKYRFKLLLFFYRNFM